MNSKEHPAPFRVSGSTTLVMYALLTMLSYGFGASLFHKDEFGFATGLGATLWRIVCGVIIAALFVVNNATHKQSMRKRLASGLFAVSASCVLLMCVEGFMFFVRIMSSS
jgi:drug/metabolite transporter (DMT)-like permease